MSYEVTRRAIAGLKDLRFYNVGLKNTAINSQAESYRVLTGPRAERAVTPGDARAFVQGHFFGSGSVGDERETVGASSSSRIWSNRSLTVSEYLAWISALNARLNGSEEVAGSQLDLVQHAKVLTKLPKVIIAAGWNKVAYRASPRVRYRAGTESPWQFRQATDLEFVSFKVSDDQKELQFLIGPDDASIPFAFSLRGGPLFSQQDSGWSIEVMTRHDNWIDFASWLSMHPPVFYSGDKSSFQGVNLMKAPSVTISTLAADDTVALDWTGCAINVEFDYSNADRNTVHKHLGNHLLTTNGLEVLIYDHRTGEAADYIAVTSEGGGGFKVSLYHCKGAGGAPSGRRVNDVYEVAGQVLKSIAYCEPSVLAQHVEHRVNEARHRQPSKFMVGDLARMKAILGQTPSNKLHFGIYGVQPGISKADIDNHLADLMAFALDYVHRGGVAKAVWLISP